MKDELFKKSIGILCYMQEASDTKITEAVFNILKKRYKRVYSFFKNYRGNEPFDMYKFLENFDPKNMSDDEFNANIAAAIYFALCLNNYCNMDVLLKCFQIRQIFYSNDKYRFSLKNISVEDEKEVGKIFKLLPKNLMDYVLSYKPPKQTAYTFLFDSEFLSSLSILNNIVYTQNDKKLIIYSYVLHKRLGHTTELMDYIIPVYISIFY